MESGLIILGAVVIGGLISFVTQWLMTWRSQRVEHAKWIREVRSEPLLAFRRELARMAQKYVVVIEVAQMQHTRIGMSEEKAREILQAVGTDWNSYMSSGSYTQAMFELDDQDIIDKAQHLWQQLAEAYVKATDVHLVFGELGTIRTGVVEIQKLINQRLQEL